jgi:zona occludens toxin
MIILVTGQPGAGKSALVVDWLATDPQFANRPLFVTGIPELQIEHTPTPPVEEWTERRQVENDPSISLAYFTFPSGSVVVVDEAQRIYRPRSAASRVPDEVAAFETHRHTGVDFILLTQHPGLLDANIRKLIGRYVHIAVTPFGRYTYEWTKCVDPDSKAEREIAARKKYKLPARSFSLYKSSEQHTKIKVAIPFYYYFAIAAVIGFICLVWYAYGRITDKFADTPVASAAAAVTQSPFSTPAPTPASKPKDYVASLEPRVPGQWHTAPRYDELTKPTDAPWPSACVENHATNTCRCLDQQGNRYEISGSKCRAIVRDGIFKDWGTAATADGVAAAERRAVAPRTARLIHDSKAGV